MKRSPIDLEGLGVAAEDLLAVVLHAAAQPILIVDDGRRVRFANDAAAAAMGLAGVGDLLAMPHDSVAIELEDGPGAVLLFNDAASHERDAMQASLRRVATLVAGGAASSEVFAAIAHEVASLLGLPLVELSRYEADGSVSVIGAWADRPNPFEAGTQWPLDGPTISKLVKETGLPVRIEAYADMPGAIADAARAYGITSAAGAPLLVDGQVWGVMATCLWDGAPPPDIEERLAEFAALIAAAFSNTATRDEYTRLADEQAGLRRVATLVARGVPPAELFAAVAREVGRLLGVAAAHIARFEPDGTATSIAAWSATGQHVPLGTRVNLEGGSVAGQVLRSGRPARMSGYERATGDVAARIRGLGLSSSVGAPIVVDQRLWGVMIASAEEDTPLPVDAEGRIAAFTELVGTAISNAHARAEIDRLAGEQAALRRVATVVARGSSPADVFAAVAEEVGRLLRVDGGTLYRFEPDSIATVVADWGEDQALLPVGTKIALGGENVATRVLHSGRSARVDDYDKASGPIGEHARRLGVRSGVGSPVVVDGRLWGALVAISRRSELLPLDIEVRIGEFTELVATAISNIDARVDLAASRARIVAAADEERRRVARDLHDGAQQRLVHTMITLKLARQGLEAGGAAAELVAEALEQAERAHVELRELVYGLLPAVLAHGGLGAGVDALASRMPVPVDHDVAVERLPASVEATAYYIVAESLTNVAKHAGATKAVVRVRLEGGLLLIQVCDDGVGGARPEGSGLLGLADRLAVFDGRLWIRSPAGQGTLVEAEIPLPTAERDAAYPGWDSNPHAP